MSVTTGRPACRTPPRAVRVVGSARAASATQSTQWMPTAACRWHSGQVGRPHRWHRTYDTRSGWRGQTGGATGAPGSGDSR